MTNKSTHYRPELDQERLKVCNITEEQVKYMTTPLRQMSREQKLEAVRIHQLYLFGQVS